MTNSIHKNKEAFLPGRASNNQVNDRIILFFWDHVNIKYYTVTEILTIIKTEGFCVTRKTIDKMVKDWHELLQSRHDNKQTSLHIEEMEIRVGNNRIPTPAYCLFDDSKKRSKKRSKKLPPVSTQAEANEGQYLPSIDSG